MRVLVVDHSGEPGGGQLGLERWSRHQSKHERGYLFLSPGPVAERMKAAGARVDFWDVEDISGPGLVRARRALRLQLDERSPEIILVNSWRAGFAVAAAGPAAPVAYYIRQDATRKSLGTAGWIAARAFVFPRCDAFIGNSDWTLETLGSRTPTVAERLVALPLSGVHGGLPKAAIAQHPSRLLWVGRIVKWKGLHLLLDALEILERRGIYFDVTVAGGTAHSDGSYRDKMLRRARRLDRPPEFLGHVEAIPDLMAASEILVHSSVSPEPFGQVIVQGMAAGLAVMAPDEGGPRSLLEHAKTGLLYRPRDASSLASGLQRLQESDGCASALGVAAREFATRSLDDRVLAAELDGVLSRIGEQAVPRRRHVGRKRLVQ